MLQSSFRLHLTGMPRVNLTRRVLTPKGYRYCPIVESANGRLKPDVVLIGGKEERHPEASFYLEWRIDGRRKRLSVGKDSNRAVTAKLKQEQKLAAMAAGLKLVEEPTDGPLLAATVAAYLEEIRISRKSKTHSAYKTALDYFLESCNKERVAAIDRSDLIKFAAFLRDIKKLSPRSCYNKFESVMSFLKAHKIRGADLGITKHDWPRYVEDEPEVFERSDLDKFFAAANEEERLCFEFFLMTGMREQEVMHCTWNDINFSRGTVTVRYKAEYGFSPKAYKGREIPVPDKLLTSLKQLKQKSQKSKAEGDGNGDGNAASASVDGDGNGPAGSRCALLFPTSGCKPKLDFLDCCKAIAKRAGLNPDDFWLHKYRATFATTSLWSGIDLRTVQSWLGHTDMQSTLRYLKPNNGHDIRSKVNAIFDYAASGY